MVLALSRAFVIESGTAFDPEDAMMGGSEYYRRRGVELEDGMRGKGRGKS